jgi:outer membrane beta-barrel protein
MYARLRRGLLAASMTLLPLSAAAQETPLDLGVLKDSDVQVVQKLLYPKAGRSEFGAQIGWMPFDSYTSTPLVGANFVKHFSEEWGLEAAAHGGFTFGNFTYRQLTSEAYGIQPDAYKHLLDLGVNAQWSPIYAKMNWRGRKVLHHDLYGLAGVAGSLEQAMMPDQTTAFSPGLSLGVGMRVFLPSGGVVRVQLRDDVLAQKRVKTADSQATFLKQNVLLTAGYSWMSKKGK